MADGGEGTLELLSSYAQASPQQTTVANAIGQPVMASWALSADGRVAFLEMAQASGLGLLKPQDRNPLRTSTWGTGQLLRQALERGCTEVILGIGGSATNDAGMGMAAALGYRFLDKNGNELSPIGQNLGQVAEIDRSGVSPLLASVRIRVACDVTSPLFGPKGAAYIFAPQKGASSEQVIQLDEGLQHLAAQVARQWGYDAAQTPGAGAAGGLGFGAQVFLGASLHEGVRLLMDYVGFEQHLDGTDWILTGEGKFDEQTIGGKLIKGLCEVARPRQIPIGVICGTLAVPRQAVQALGIAYATSIVPEPMSLSKALKYGYAGVSEAAFYWASLVEVQRRQGTR
jgi:glycerate kinase